MVTCKKPLKQNDSRVQHGHDGCLPALHFNPDRSVGIILKPTAKSRSRKHSIKFHKTQ